MAFVGDFILLLFFLLMLGDTFDLLPLEYISILLVVPETRNNCEVKAYFRGNKVFTLAPFSHPAECFSP